MKDPIRNYRRVLNRNIPRFKEITKAVQPEVLKSILLDDDFLFFPVLDKVEALRDKFEIDPSITSEIYLDVIRRKSNLTDLQIIDITNDVFKNYFSVWRFIIEPDFRGFSVIWDNF